ncbi:MAG TPA: HAMP domain-containing sensor histidine kinase [Ktedonosporobacter sp.]|jgi:signal transduction histidine kinase|nr:HAMP domain-containing sensor histidine kinase [Ktedonosporobacter sp.]
MKYAHRVRVFSEQIHLIPLFLLRLSLGTRLFIVLLSYGIGIPGLWFFFPQLHNGASMLVPIICLCWLFSYRGLLLSLLTTVGTMVLVYYYLLKEPATDQALAERAVVGLGVALLLGLAICWLRKAVDLVSVARQQALAAEHKHLLAVERAQQVTIAYEQQCKINELKDQFLLNVSHELRTPLTVLGGSLELLKEYYEKLEPVQRAKMLNRALASQETLVDFVNRVLDTTAVVSDIPFVEPEGFCLHQWLREVLTQLAPQEKDAYTICLQVPEQIMVWADPQLLRQVIQNLLSNIFKYVPRQTTIHIVASHAAPSAPVCLAVQDAGPGIPTEELPLLFEKFVRLKRDVAGTTRGTGLGLYLCKRLVEAMHGRIWVESSGRPGEGSRFCLTLPPFVAC